MAIPSRQIGWGTEDNLLWQISKQLEQLTNVTAKTCANNAPTYKVYTALLERTGAAAPTATILENTLGTVTFAYTGPGNYGIGSSSLFTLNKTFITITPAYTSAIPGNTLSTAITSNSNISILQTTTAGINDADWTFPVSVEIRVYN